MTDNDTYTHRRNRELASLRKRITNTDDDRKRKRLRRRLKAVKTGTALPRNV